MDGMEDYSWVSSYLTSGEQILWRGKPEKYSIFNKNDLYLIPFSILWCGFAIFWEWGVITSRTPLMFWLWGIPFVCAGLYFVIGRFFHRSYLLRRSAYVITDRKIIRKSGKKVDMLQKNSLPHMQVDRKSDGSGTIRFAMPRSYMAFNLSFFEYYAGFSLVGLSDVRRALNAIETMQSSGEYQ
ncbi:MAG: hypothetical protein IKI49_00100 [Oscillospiraceae bacterium]|nr:hypothetical protein [Oscillospiraceae bacterium]